MLGANQTKRLRAMCIIVSRGLGQILVPGQSQEAYREIAQSGHGLRTRSGPDLGSVLVKCHVPDPVDLIFDAPMPLHEVQEGFW